MLSNPPSKKWIKKLMNTSMNSTIEEIWQQDIKSKSSLKHIYIDSL